MAALRQTGQPVVIYYGTEIQMSHDTSVDQGTAYSEEAARGRMVWNHDDAKLREYIRHLFLE